MAPPSPQKIPFTQEMFDSVHENIKTLEKKREETLERLKVAREQGDLSENGAYRYAKQELGDIARRHRQLRFFLLFGHVVPKQTNGIVGFGNKVTVSDGKKETSYTIVSKYESDPKAHKLSMESPLGKLLIGKQMSDVVTLHAPVGDITYTIKDVQ